MGPSVWHSTHPVSLCLNRLLLFNICCRDQTFQQLLEVQDLLYFTGPLTIYQDALLPVIFKALVVFVINAFHLVTKLEYLGGGGLEETADAQWVKWLGHRSTPYAFVANLFK